MVSQSQAGETLALNPLTPDEERVIVHKGTELPHTGKYERFNGKGVYLCKRCNAPLYRSESKFDAGCGWPSFDEEIPGAVKRIPDADGQRMEIVCAHCGAHLGHVFIGEGLTPKNTRHCVNSISLKFQPADQGATVSREAPPSVASAPAHQAQPAQAPQPAVQAPPKTETAVFASGCFWGSEYVMSHFPGVISTRVGYTGGHTEQPTYQQVCSGTTGHAEAVEVTFDPQKTSYETLAKHFFETHDPTQVDRQGPDVGEQYRSVIYYRTDGQKQTAERLIEQLRRKGLKVATQLERAGKFWPAEAYHQKYYEHTGGKPYCHVPHKLWEQ